MTPIGVAVVVGVTVATSAAVDRGKVTAATSTAVDRRKVVVDVTVATSVIITVDVGVGVVVVVDIGNPVKLSGNFFEITSVDSVLVTDFNNLVDVVVQVDNDCGLNVDAVVNHLRNQLLSCLGEGVDELLQDNADVNINVD